MLIAARGTCVCYHGCPAAACRRQSRRAPPLRTCGRIYLPHISSSRISSGMTIDRPLAKGWAGRIYLLHISSGIDRPLARGWAVSEEPPFGTWLVRIEAG